MQPANNVLEDLYTLERFVKEGGVLADGPSVLFHRLAARYPLHFIQFMYKHGREAGGGDTVYRHLPGALDAVRQLSGVLEHHLIQEPRSAEERAAFRDAVEGLESRLWLQQFNDKRFTHFLDIDQYTDDGEGLGIQSLFYHREGATLHIHLTSREGRQLGAHSYPAGEGSVKEVLSAFLLQYFSEPGSHSGDNQYLWSNIISRKEFEAASNVGLAVKRRKKTAAERLGKDNELIRYCAQHHLSPRPEGSNETAWLARCPSGGNHTILISTASNQWGCGYCRKKGGLEKLKQWVES